MVSRRLFPIMLAATAVAAAACGGGAPEGAGAGSAKPAPSLQVSSPGWPEGGKLRPPTACAQRGDPGRSPALRWSAGPSGTQFYDVTVEDPDADGFLHWAALNLPAGTTSLAAGKHRPARQLRNDFGDRGYGAPCPPQGETHHYTLTVWALPGKVSSVDRLRDEALASGTVTAEYGR